MANKLYRGRNLISSIQNKRVADYFNWTLNADEIEVRDFCLINDSDNILEAIMSLLFFYLIIFFNQENQYYLPDITFHDTYQFLPQIQLIFKENRSKYAKMKRISFRLIREISSQDDLNFIHHAMNGIADFSYTWSSKDKYSYKELNRSIQVLIFTNDIETVKTIVNLIYTINGLTSQPNWTLIKHSTNPQSTSNQTALVYLNKVELHIPQYNSMVIWDKRYPNRVPKFENLGKLKRL